MRVNKVDSTTGKVVEGAAEGLRFYLPRPYLSVFEPFIVASDVYLAKGELSPDGNYVLLTQVPQGLDAIVHQALKGGATQSMGRLSIDASQVTVAPGAVSGPQSAPAGTDEKKDDKAAGKKDGKKDDKKDDQGEKQDGDAKPPAATVQRGMLSYKTTNDNAAFAVTPQPRYFNILWLPDFDEQYVITARAGLGNSGVVINFGQGWSLQGLDATVDNSALAKPLLDFYTGTIGALEKLATAKIQGPLAALTGAAGPQSVSAKDTKSTAKDLGGGTPVTVKVTKVRIVAPGLYPILKPAELRTAPGLGGAESARILAPHNPLTNIAFNTYDAVVIEAARSTGDTALRIHQYVDSTVSGTVQPGTTGNQTDPQKPSGTPPTPARQVLNQELSKPEYKTKTGEFYEATLTNDGKATKVALRKRNGKPDGKLDKLPAADALKKLVIDTLKKQKIEVKSEDITIAG